MLEKVQFENITLIHGDCLNVMQSLGDGSIDAIITDPPYGNTDLHWDKKIDWQEYWATITKVRTNASVSVLFSTQKFTLELIQSNLKEFRYWIVWKKTTPVGFLNANRRPLRSHELINVFTPVGKHNQSTYNPIMTPAERYFKRGGNRKFNHYIAFKPMVSTANERYPVDVIEFTGDTSRCNSTKTHQDTFHPTQKPVDLMEWLVYTYSNENETVLDPFMGSGTTGVACVNTERRFIGIEKDRKYFEMACQRIEKAIRDQSSKLFSVPKFESALSQQEINFQPKVKKSG